MNNEQELIRLIRCAKWGILASLGCFFLAATCCLLLFIRLL